jgi:hypothetical protein
MAFSVGVELLNLRMRGRSRNPVRLREPYAAANAVEGEGPAG